MTQPKPLAAIAEVVLDDKRLVRRASLNCKPRSGRAVPNSNEGRQLTRSGNATESEATHDCEGATEPLVSIVPLFLVSLAFGMIVTIVVYLSARRAFR